MPNMTTQDAMQFLNDVIYAAQEGYAFDEPYWSNFMEVLSPVPVTDPIIVSQPLTEIALSLPEVVKWMAKGQLIQAIKELRGYMGTHDHKRSGLKECKDACDAIKWQTGFYHSSNSMNAYYSIPVEQHPAECSGCTSGQSDDEELF